MSAAADRRRTAHLLVRTVCGVEPWGGSDDELRLLLDAAQRHRVLPTLAWRLGEAGVLPRLPWGALQLLLHEAGDPARAGDPRLALLLVAHATGQRSANLHDTTAVLTGALREAGVPVVRLKGAHLEAAGWFPSGARGAQDVDLLVRRDDGARAMAVLREQGWSEYESSEPWRQRAEHHLPAMVREGHAGSVELHVELLPPRWRRVLRADEVWDGVVEGPSGPVLRDDHAVTLTVLHAMGSDGAWRGRMLPVRALCDLSARAANAALGPVDGVAVAERFAQRGEAEMLAGLGAIAQRLGVALPFLQSAEDERVRRAGATWARRTWWLVGHPALATRVRTTAVALSQLNVEQLASHYGPQVRAHPRRAQVRYLLDRVRRQRSQPGGSSGDDRA